MKLRYKITLCYFGKNFFGWQIQPKHLTIQQLLEEKLSLLLKEKIKVIGASRTDSHVHALHQCAHFDSSKKFCTEKLKTSLNGLLFSSIRILDIEETESSFHARYSAKGKTYRYLICNDEKYFPFLQNLCFLTRKKIDIDKLKRATFPFLGRHNFLSFANKGAKGCAKNKPLKTIYRFIALKKDFFYILEITGDGFLYKMVRNIIGTLLAINDNKLSISDIKNILSLKDRTKAFAPAPAEGLYLMKVHYHEEEIAKMENEDKVLESFFPFDLSFDLQSKPVEPALSKEP